MDDAREVLPSGFVQKNMKKRLDHVIWVPVRNF